MKVFPICLVLLLLCASAAAGQHVHPPVIGGAAVEQQPRLALVELTAPGWSPGGGSRWKGAMIGAGAGVLLSGAFLYVNCGVIFCGEMLVLAVPVAAVAGAVLGASITHP